MKNAATILLQAFIVLLGIVALVFLLWEPHVEGRNAGATLFQIYFQDPFLAFAYVGSVPFFVALYQAFRALPAVRRNETGSPATLKRLRTIKHCALIVLAFVAVGEMFIVFDGGEDRPQGVFMGLLVAVPSLVVAVAASKLETPGRRIGA
jgi:hypothetical protein